MSGKKADDKKAPSHGSPSADPAPEKHPTYRQLYDRYLPVAKALPAQDVEVCRADPRVAFANVRIGVKNVCGTEEQRAFVRKHLPELPLTEVVELPDVARALIFSLGKVIARTASPKEIEDKVKEISGPREQLLAQAELLAKRGKLDKDRITQIRSGSGKYDMAKDGIDLVEVFTERWDALQGLHPFSRDELKRLQEASEWLLEHLTPAGARAGTKEKNKNDAADVRDRLWTLLVKRHPYVRKIGFYLYDDELDAHTPKLQSRVPQATLDEERGDETPAEPAPDHEPADATPA
jgi:hypothetical protein